MTTSRVSYRILNLWGEKPDSSRMIVVCVPTRVVRGMKKFELRFSQIPSDAIWDKIVV